MEYRPEITLLSESAIGSPNAFSTAVKPPQANSSSTLANMSTEVTGCISLESSVGESSVGGPESLLSSPVESEERNSSSRRTNFSANESSLGILDLDAMQSDGSTSDMFLTSPRGSPHGFRLRLTPTISSNQKMSFSRTPVISTVPTTNTNNGDAGDDGIGSYHKPSGLATPGYIKPPIISAAGDKDVLSKPLAPIFSGTDFSSNSFALIDGSIDNSKESVGGDTDSSRKFFSPVSDNSADGGARKSLNGGADDSSKPFASGSGINHSNKSFTSVANSFPPDITLQAPPVIGAADTPSHSPVSATNKFSATVMSRSNESLVGHVSSHETFASSLGLPSELLGGLSSHSGSSCFASDSEGETIRSALASALALHNAEGGVVYPSSLESTMDGVASFSQSLSQDGYPGEQNNLEHFGEKPVPRPPSLPVPRPPVLAVDRTDGDPPLSSGKTLSVRDSSHSTPKSTRHSETHLSRATLAPAHREAKGGVSPSSASESLDGLPSAYLNAQDLSLGNDVSAGGYTFSNLDPGTPIGSDTTLVSSLAGSLVDFAGVLGKEEEGVGGDEELGGVYNPFDDKISFDQAGFEELKFEGIDSNRLSAQLNKDEQEMVKFNLSQDPSVQGLSFESATSINDNFIDSSGEHSVTSYFKKKSNSMGYLTTVKMPSLERPHFSDSSSRIITSPSPTDYDDSVISTTNGIAQKAPLTGGDVMNQAPPTSSDVMDQAPPIEISSSLDETLLAHADPSKIPPLQSVVVQSFDSLTPVISNCTPFPKVPVPKFSLGETLSPGVSTPPGQALATTGGTLSPGVSTPPSQDPASHVAAAPHTPMSVPSGHHQLEMMFGDIQYLTEYNDATPSNSVLSHLPPALIRPHPFATGDTSEVSEWELNSSNMRSGLSSIYLKSNSDSISVLTEMSGCATPFSSTSVENMSGNYTLTSERGSHKNGNSREREGSTLTEDPHTTPAITEDLHNTPEDLRSTPTPEDPHTTPVVTTPEDPHTTPVVTTPEDPHTTPVVTTPEDLHSTPVVTTPEEPHTTPVVTTPEDPRTTPVVTIPEEPHTTPVVTTPEDPRTTPVVTEDPHTTPVVTTPEDLHSTPVITSSEPEQDAVSEAASLDRRRPVDMNDTSPDDVCMTASGDMASSSSLKNRKYYSPRVRTRSFGIVEDVRQKIAQLRVDLEETRMNTAALSGSALGTRHSGEWTSPLVEINTVGAISKTTLNSTRQSGEWRSPLVSDVELKATNTAEAISKPIPNDTRQRGEWRSPLVSDEERTFIPAIAEATSKSTEHSGEWTSPSVSDEERTFIPAISRANSEPTPGTAAGHSGEWPTTSTAADTSKPTPSTNTIQSKEWSASLISDKERSLFTATNSTAGATSITPTLSTHTEWPASLVGTSFTATNNTAGVTSIPTPSTATCREGLSSLVGNAFITEATSTLTPNTATSLSSHVTVSTPSLTTSTTPAFPPSQFSQVTFSPRKSLSSTRISTGINASTPPVVVKPSLSPTTSSSPAHVYQPSPIPPQNDSVIPMSPSIFSSLSQHNNTARNIMTTSSPSFTSTTPVGTSRPPKAVSFSSTTPVGTSPGEERPPKTVSFSSTTPVGTSPGEERPLKTVSFSSTTPVGTSAEERPPVVGGKAVSFTSSTVGTEGLPIMGDQTTSPTTMSTSTEVVVVDQFTGYSGTLTVLSSESLPLPIFSDHAHLTYTSPPLQAILTTSPLAHTSPGSLPIETVGVLTPESCSFAEVCCVGAQAVDHFSVTNSGSHWLQLHFSISHLHLNGEFVEDPWAFELPDRIFVRPSQSEPVKVIFNPSHSGTYQAVVFVYASPMTSNGRSRDKPTASVVLTCTSEDPQVELYQPKLSNGGSGGGGVPDILDYGVLVGGSTIEMPLELMNRGQSETPLKISITSENLCFRLLPLSLDSSPSHTRYFHPHSLSVVLPPTPSNGTRGSFKPHRIGVSFSAPKKFISDLTSDPGPPEVMTAQLEVTVDGTKPLEPIRILPLRAVVGVARLFVPRSLLALSLSCAVGNAVTRDIPIKNIGNVPLNVRLEVGGVDPTHFSLVPLILQMNPTEESKVAVTFDPPTGPLISEGCVKIHIEPGGPWYELKIRGTATDPPNHEKGMLTCKNRFLFWGGVSLGESKELKVALHNSFPIPIPLKLSIRHHPSPFQLEQETLVLLPDEEASVSVTYFPFLSAVSISALDIIDQAHTKKYRIPLCGYGGVSKLEVGGASTSLGGQLFLDIGEVKCGRGIKFKVLLYNSGSRASFVQVQCHSLDNSAPLLDSHARLVPPHLVIRPHSTGQIQLFYRPDQGEEDNCSVSKSPLSYLVVRTGDEVMRQLLVKSTAQNRGVSTDQRRGRKSVSTRNKEFVKEFSDQDLVPTELDLLAFRFDDHVEKVFSDALTTLTVTLTGSPKPVKPVPNLSRSGKDITPLHSRIPLSPSYTPVENSAHTRNKKDFKVLSTLLLRLPETAVGQTSGNFFEIMNPFSAHLYWEMSPYPLSTIKENTGGGAQGGGAYTKSPLFSLSVLKGCLVANSQVKIEVTFQPREEGSHSQMWKLKVSGPIDLRIKKYEMSFAGVAMATHSPLPPLRVSASPLNLRDSQKNVAQWVSQTRHHMMEHEAASKSILTPRPVSDRKPVYLSSESVRFSDTKARHRSTVKVRLCNRDSISHSFEVIRPPPPFNVDHFHFVLESRQCARLPIHFSPSVAGEFEGVLAVRTCAGHQTFTQLRGTATL